MRILFKIPSRSRPQKLLDCLSKVKSLADDVDSIRIVMTLDTDDHSMTPDYEKQLLSEFGEIRYHNCTSKIDAINRDLEGDEEIIVLGSDDMIAEIQGWDTIIKEKMVKEFPNLDGALFFNDGYRSDLNTMTIMSRKLYNEYGYLYHPSYKSLFCDDEWTIIGKATKKLVYDPRVIFRHEHCANNRNIIKDELYTINDTFWNRDQLLFVIRKQAGFPKEVPFFYCMEKVVSEADTNLDPSYRLKSSSLPQNVFISIDQIDTFIQLDKKVIKLYINSKDKQFTNEYFTKVKDLAENVFATNNVSDAHTLALGLVNDSILPHIIYTIPTEEKDIHCSCGEYFRILNNLDCDTFSDIITNLQRYKILARSKYVLCPVQIADTHLIYEALHWNCIPVVLSGPYNVFYEMIGCRIVQDWNDITLLE